MLKLSYILLVLTLSMAGATLVGCSKEQPPAPKQPAPAMDQVPADKSAARAADESAMQEKSPSAVPAEFASLSETDRAAAMAQKVCPVSGEALGEMGAPIKVTVKGRDVFLCCPSCKEDLMKDPDKFLAKLDAK